MVEIGVGECDARDGRLTHALPRMQLGGGFDLRAQVGRRAQQEPRAGILGEGDLSLRARLAAKCTNSYGAAIRTGAIPLRKRAAGR